MEYKIYYCIADYDEVLTKCVETEDIEDWCECFMNNSELDIYIDFVEKLSDGSKNED